MPLARDLNDLIQKYGSAIATAAEAEAEAEAVLKPRHNPNDPLPDLSVLEQCRTKQSSKPFTFYPSQQQKIAGALAGLKSKGSCMDGLRDGLREEPYESGGSLVPSEPSQLPPARSLPWPHCEKVEE